MYYRWELTNSEDVTVDMCIQKWLSFKIEFQSWFLKIYQTIIKSYFSLRHSEKIVTENYFYDSYKKKLRVPLKCTFKLIFGVLRAFINLEEFKVYF